MDKEKGGHGSELYRQWNDVRGEESINKTGVWGLVLPFSTGCLEGTCLLHRSFPVIEKYNWGEIKIGEDLVGERHSELST